MKIETLVVYDFLVSSPDDVEIFANKCHRYAMRGYKPLFTPSLFDSTIIQQWGIEEDNNKINSLDFRLFINRVILVFDKKWDNKRWAQEYEKFDEWLYKSNSSWCSGKSATKLYRRFAIESYAGKDIIKDGYSLKSGLK